MKNVELWRLDVDSVDILVICTLMIFAASRDPMKIFKDSELELNSICPCMAARKRTNDNFRHLYENP
jgi:hypothetical protein